MPCTTLYDVTTIRLYNQTGLTTVICGIQKLPQRTKRIVGGRVSPPGRWPWMVLVMVTPRNKTIWDSLYCGGVLITNQHILTAAHCLSRWDISFFRLKYNSNFFFFYFQGRQSAKYYIRDIYFYLIFNASFWRISWVCTVLNLFVQFILQ